MKDLQWLVSSKKDLMKFPSQVIHEMGYALYLAQMGKTSPYVKKFKGFGANNFEIVCRYDTDAYRLIYALKENTVFVIHAFQKKSNKGIKTPKQEIEIIRQRLKQLMIYLVGDEI